MQRQAADDLRREADAYAALKDGRRAGLFTSVCRVGRYVSHGLLTEPAVVQAMTAAAIANGAVAAHGTRWCSDAIARGLKASLRDTLPPLARRFREVRAS